MTAPVFPSAVLWDMDGTIIDTEPYWIAEETSLVEHAGGTWSEAQGMEMVGNDLRHSAQIMLDRTPITGSSDDVVDALLSGVIQRVRAHMPWRPGARELIDELRVAGVPMALVTMSWQPLAQALVQRLPTDTFATVVTGDAVPRGKPHPDPYLIAAQRLGVDPADCIAIEDSPTGVRAAVAAGVPTVAVAHMVQVEPTAGALSCDTLEGMRLADLRALFARG